MTAQKGRPPSQGTATLKQMLDYRSPNHVTVQSCSLLKTTKGTVFTSRLDSSTPCAKRSQRWSPTFLLPHLRQFLPMCSTSAPPPIRQNGEAQPPTPASSISFAKCFSLISLKGKMPLTETQSPALP